LLVGIIIIIHYHLYIHVYRAQIFLS
jgi:hypothetical protein